MWGEKGLIEFGLGPAPSPARLANAWGDFHVTLKLLVFLPEAEAAAGGGGLNAGGCLRDGNEVNAVSRACAVCARACVRVSVAAVGSFSLP